MALNESIRQVDAAIRASIERSLAELRGELERRLKASNEDLVSLLEPNTLPLPSSLLPADAVADLEREAGAAARTFAHEELLEQVTRLDRARSQAEVLRALTRAAIAYASRVVIWLVDREGGHGHALEGFPPDAHPENLSFRWSDLGSTRAAGLAEGRSVIALSASDARSLLGEWTADSIEEGFLIPLVLRDRVAAALYADGGGAGSERHLDRAALQLLTYQAALALETLAFRSRSSTPTLAASPSLAGPGLPLWPPDDLAESATAPVPLQPAAPPVVAPAVLPAALPAVPPIPRSEAGRAELFAPPTAAEVAPPPARPASPTDGAGRTGSSAGQKTEPVFPAALGVEAPRGALPLPAPVPPSAESDEDLPELVLEPLPDFEPGELELETPGEPWTFTPPPPAGPAETLRIPSFAAPTGPSGPSGGATTFQVPVVPPPSSIVPPAARDAGTSTAAIDASEDTTLLIERRSRPAPPLTPRFDGDETFPGPAARFPSGPPASPAAATPSPAPASSAPVAAANASATAEVRAPFDLQGPGRAFVPARPATSANEALHEEARRLARLLVSEIKLYNEDQVEQGRRHGDIYSRLREDIERSRQMYEDRIDTGVRASSDYFQGELVRILAGGDARGLGTA